MILFSAPLQFCRSLCRHRALLLQLTRRDIAGRYRGSSLGIFWTFLTPLLLLSVYTFVFTHVFAARPWRVVEGAHETGSFALLVFAGLIVHTGFSEAIARSPGLIASHTNYVKKVVFPLELLPAMALGSVAFHMTASTLVLGVATLLVQGALPWTFLLFPLALLPFALLTLGVSLFLASLGVYLRDVGQIMGLVTTMLMFLSPVFYPVESLPEWLQPWMWFNPLTLPILALRDVALFGAVPEAIPFLLYSAASLIVFAVGAAWFHATRKGFADVL